MTKAKAKPAVKKKDVEQDKKINKLIKQMAKRELKFFDVGNGSYQDVTQTALIYNLSNIAQGTDDINRIGNSIVPKNLEIRYIVQVDTAGTNGSIYNKFVRVVIVQDKEQQGTDPTFAGADTSVYNPVTTGVNEHMVPILFTNRKRYKILHDEVHAMGANTFTTVGAQTAFGAPLRVFKHKKFKLNGTINYDATAGADTSNREGALYLMVISPSNTTDSLDFGYFARLTFTDS